MGRFELLFYTFLFILALTVACTVMLPPIGRVAFVALGIAALQHAVVQGSD